MNDTGVTGGTKPVFGAQGSLPWETMSRLPRVQDGTCVPKRELPILRLLKVKEGSVFYCPHQFPISTSEIHVWEIFESSKC